MEKMSEETTKNGKYKEFFSNLRTIGITIVCTLLFIYFVAQLTIVNGESMMPTLHNGDLCIMEKITTRFGHLKRNDVIVLKTKEENKPFFIKRVIGLPGETVRIDEDGTIFINDEVYNDEYGAETIKNPGNAIDGIVLGEDEYFFLGDNRNNSNDARFIGPVKKKDIAGHVIFNFVVSRNPYKKRQ